MLAVSFASCSFISLVLVVLVVRDCLVLFYFFGAVVSIILCYMCFVHLFTFVISLVLTWSNFGVFVGTTGHLRWWCPV